MLRPLFFIGLHPQLPSYHRCLRQKAPLHEIQRKKRTHGSNPHPHSRRSALFLGVLESIRPSARARAADAADAADASAVAPRLAMIVPEPRAMDWRRSLIEPLLTQASERRVNGHRSEFNRVKLLKFRAVLNFTGWRSRHICGSSICGT